MKRLTTSIILVTTMCSIAVLTALWIATLKPTIVTKNARGPSLDSLKAYSAPLTSGGRLGNKFDLEPYKSSTMINETNVQFTPQNQRIDTESPNYDKKKSSEPPYLPPPPSFDPHYDMQADFSIRASISEAQQFINLNGYDARSYSLYWSHKIFQLHPMIIELEANFIHQLLLGGHNKALAKKYSELIYNERSERYLNNFSMICSGQQCKAIWDKSSYELNNNYTWEGYSLDFCNTTFNTLKNCQIEVIVDSTISAIEYAKNHTLCHSGSSWQLSHTPEPYSTCMKFLFKERQQLTFDLNTIEGTDSTLSFRDLLLTVDKENQPILKSWLVDALYDFNIKHRLKAKLTSFECNSYCEVTISNALPSYASFNSSLLNDRLQKAQPIPFTFPHCEFSSNLPATEQLQWRELKLLCGFFSEGVLYSHNPNNSNEINTY